MSITLREKRKVLLSDVHDTIHDKMYGILELYYSTECEVGTDNHWFMCFQDSPASRTWLNDIEAGLFIADTIVDELIEEEKIKKGF